MSCVTVDIPDLVIGFGITIPDISFDLPGLDLNLCCRIATPNLPITIPTSLLATLIPLMTQPLVFTLSSVSDAINTAIEALPLKCPLD